MDEQHRHVRGQPDRGLGAEDAGAARGQERGLGEEQRRALPGALAQERDRFPVVPKGQARIRVQLSAAHSLDEVDRCVDAFTRVGKELRVIS